MLRSQIEFNVPSPALVLVTSALVGDGSRVTAITIADCLAAAGHRVALMLNYIDHLAMLEERPRFAVHPLPEHFGTRRPVDDVAKLAEKMRSEYDYTVIDARPIAENALTVVLAGTADVVLLSIRVGRPACPDDDVMMQALQHAQARVLGVIGASEASIAAFDESVLQSTGAVERIAHSQPPSNPATSTATAK